jgi:peptide/nickel transport system ATP-binding protein
MAKITSYEGTFMSDDILLEVKGLRTYFFLDEGIVKAVQEVDFPVKRGATLGIVGESGCGKSVTAFSILQLVSKPGRIVQGQILLHRRSNGNNGNSGRSEDVSSVREDVSSVREEIIDIAALEPNSSRLRDIRGKEIAMIFQEPMTSLSMMHTVGFQIEEAILLHLDMNKEEAHQHAIEMLRQVGIPNPELHVDDYPFQLSGGMRQRVMIAMALSCSPSMLIADEPTTALDVTTQAQILELMLGLQEERGMAIMMITHDLGVIAEICEEVVVMYLGEVVERANVDALFHDPQHPYTRALLKSIPVLGMSKAGRLTPIEGSVPDPYNRPSGCPFHTRCESVMPGQCDVLHPKLIELPDGRNVRCLLYGEGEHKDE